MKHPQKSRWLAHFVSGGGQDVYGATRDEAIHKGKAAARRRGTQLADVTGPDTADDTLLTE